MTLIELLVTTAIIGILASMVLGALGKAKPRATRAGCLSNLRQTGIGFTFFANDHNGAFPLDVPAAGGGAREFRPGGLILAEVPQAFLCLSNELGNPKVLVCPADSRVPARSFATFNKTNLSFFAGLQASPSMPASVLAGDRNVIFQTNGALSWNREMHGAQGNLLLADGHVEQRIRFIWPTPAGISTGGSGGGGSGPAGGSPSISSSANRGVSGPPASSSKPPRLGDIIEPTSAAPAADSDPQPAALVAAKSTPRTSVSAQKPDKPSPAPIQAVVLSNSPAPVPPAAEVPTTAPSSGEPQERDSLLIRIAQWAVVAGSLVSLMVAFVILLLMALKKMRSRRANSGVADLPSEET